MSNKELLITLESPEFYEKSERLNSPRSLEALRILGLSPQELYPLTFDEYLLQNPSSRNLTEALQEQRYSHFENYRKKNLSLAQSQRKVIIESEQNKQNKSNISTSQDNSAIIKHQQEQLEKMKQKQFCRIKQKIDYEVKMAALRKQTEEKQRLLIERDIQKKLALLELEKQMKDKDKQRLIKLAEHKAKLKQEEEQRYRIHTEENKLRAQQEQERMRKEEQKRNEVIQMRIKRDEELKKKIESMRDKQRLELSMIQKQIEEKENERKKYIERIRSASSKILIEKMQKNQNKKDIKLIKNDSINHALLYELENKQQRIKERKQRVENEKKEKAMKEQEKRNKQIEKLKEIKINNDKLL